MAAANITIELCAEDRARLDRIIAELSNLAGNPRQEQPNIETQANTFPVKEKPPHPTETVTEGPEITLEQVQKKVVQLAAGWGGAKKAQVRAIINDYAPKVPDLPVDKLPEVWERLLALEAGA